MSSTGSISVSGLLGGTAGQIDVTSLVTQLVAAAAVPQTQLQDQLSTVSSQLSAYQAINTRLKAVQTAAQALTDPTAWQATTATSSSSAVVASSGTTATTGSTTFSVTQLARAQVTTVAADSSGAVVTQPSAGITVKDAAGISHNIPLTSGSAADVAAAINSANIGVHASAVQTSAGVVLQVTSSKTGTANGFSIDPGNTTNAPRDIVAARDAAVSVGDAGNGGYTVTSSSNTFTDVVPGVTFSVNALADDVTVTVGSDQQSISDKASALVDAVNAAMTTISAATAKGAILQGKYDAASLASQLAGAVSAGSSSGASLKKFGIDIDSSGQLSFDATAFASAYAADPSATKTAVGSSFAASLDATTTAAIAPVTGSITSAIAGATSQSTNLNDEIGKWTTKLDTIKSNLQAKYAAMETALARLQSQQTYLKSMFDSMTSSSSSSSSS